LHLPYLRSVASLFSAILLTIAIIPLGPIQNLEAFGQIEEQKQGEIVSCNCIAFRFDDVQDYFLNRPQMEVINTFEEKNASLTVGIIGNHFGDDAAMRQFIQEKTAVPGKSDGFSVEVANHGWKHEDFTLFTKDEQSALIRQTDEKIMETLGVKPVVFVAPYNRVNADTIAALAQNGFTHLSTNTTSSYPASVLQLPDEDDSNATVTDGTDSESHIIHFPSSANTGDLNDDDTEWLGKTHDETFSEITESMSKLGYAVVTMHPMEFASRSGTAYLNEADDAQIRELELLIDKIRDSGLRIVTISQIDSGFVAIPEFSSYSIFAILAASVVMTIWLSSRRAVGFWKNKSIAKDWI